MIKAGLIGNGRWGKILNKKLTEISDLVFVSDSKTPYMSRLAEVDWVVVATPNNSHYTIVKDCLLSGKNVFCEKPLTPSYEQSKELYELAERLGVSLYTSDVENFKDHSFIFLNQNFVERSKVESEKAKNLLYALAYHDFYLLYKYTKEKKPKDIKIYNSNDLLNFKILFDDIQVEFLYSTCCEHKKHKINNYNLVNDHDALKDMLIAVFNKNVDFDNNKQSALYANNLIDLINNELYKGDTNV